MMSEQLYFNQYPAGVANCPASPDWLLSTSTCSLNACRVLFDSRARLRGIDILSPASYLLWSEAKGRWHVVDSESCFLGKQKFMRRNVNITEYLFRIFSERERHTERERVDCKFVFYRDVGNTLPLSLSLLPSHAVCKK